MIKKLLLHFLIIVLLGFLGLYFIGSYLTKSSNTTIGLPPSKLNAIQLQINEISGWFHQSDTSNKCVLLLHGVRSNKLSMVNRAEFLNQLGYSTLLIDLQAHGETPGDDITFGLKESDNVKSAIDFLKSKNCQKIGAIGVSLGGASILLGNKPANLDAVILEAVYPSIDQAVINRIEQRLGAFAANLLAPTLYYQIPLRQNISLNSLKPINAISTLKVPVLIIGGSEDLHTKIEETKNLFAAANEPKTLWIINEPAHVDFHSFAKDQYETRISDFFSRYL
jgi:uncharacterized protein